MSFNIRKSIARIFKASIFLLLEVLIFFFITRHLGGITLPDFTTTLLIVLALSIVNALLWPVISYVSLKFIVFTLGFGTFLIDGLILFGLSMYFPGVRIEGISLFSIPLLLGLINSLLSLLMGMDTDSTYYKRILKRGVESDDFVTDTGYVFLEIDGLAYDILCEAMDNGKMPFLSKCLEDGTHKVTKWETDLSSQTSASQAGILHGNNSNIPAFRWVEKEHGNRIVASNSLSDAVCIEKRISDGNGLLSDHGASRSNLFSGDAVDYMLTYSKFSKLSKFYTVTWYYLYSSPYVMTRIIILFLYDMLRELISRIVHTLKDIRPRIHRSLAYFVARSGANIVMREATTLTLIGDIYAGEYNVMYSTYMGYDEIAHHSGIRDNDSFYALKQIDGQIERISDAIAEAKRDYKFIVLSDHGQSGGPTFKQKYGITLNDLVSEYLPEQFTIHSILHSNDDHFGENFTIDSLANHNREKLKQLKNKAKSNRTIRDMMDRREYFRQKDPILTRLKRISDNYDMEMDLPEDEVVIDKAAQSIVLASGNLGLIYFTDWPGRMTYEQIEDAFPGLIRGLAHHDGIGFVMVKSAVLGTIILSGDDVYYMDTDMYVGSIFLKDYGENVVDHLKRTDSFDHVPDILVNSKYDKELDEVYAFEELIGSHGGIGGPQQEPFIMYPSDWQLDGKIIGAQEVHKFFKKEINRKRDDSS